MLEIISLHKGALAAHKIPNPLPIPRSLYHLFKVVKIAIDAPARAVGITDQHVAISAQGCARFGTAKNGLAGQG